MVITRYRSTMALQQSLPAKQRKMAEKRLIYLQWRLNKNPYASKVPQQPIDEKVDTGGIWNLPHNPVLHTHTSQAKAASYLIAAQSTEIHA